MIKSLIGMHLRCWGLMMFRMIAIVAGLGLALAGSAEAQTPRKGGTIRMTAPYGSSFTSLDIHTTQRAQDEIYAKALHRSLYVWNSAEGKPVLELAKEDAVSGGGLVHTFKLRDDAYFHNGRKMTADDVIWSYTRIMDGTKAFPGARFVRVIEGAAAVEKGQAKEISGLKKIDDFTLEMKLTEKVDPGFYFFTALTSIYPADEGAKESFIQKPIGLGPFKFVEHVPGSRIVLERWDRFYKPGKPYADKIVVSVMGEAAARDVAFRNKEIDTSVLGPAQYVAYQSDAALKGTIVEVAEVFTRYMGMNPSFKPFADKRVRQAINYAIDTDLIITKLVKGKAYRATSWLPLTAPAYDKAMKPYPYDPAKAKQLLAEAGYLTASNLNGPPARMKAGACRSSRPSSRCWTRWASRPRSSRSRPRCWRRWFAAATTRLSSIPRRAGRIRRPRSNASTRRRRSRPATTRPSRTPTSTRSSTRPGRPTIPPSASSCCKGQCAAL